MDKIEKGSFFNRHKTFLVLLLIGLILRVLFIEFQGLSSDELSAWYRTRFSMGEEFWTLGVSQGDMHPAFYQVLLWIWVRVFGDSEFSLRATSLLFFAASLSLIYRIGCRFFSKYSANLISAFYVSLGFLIVNSTTARPYNSGVFFLLLTFYLVLILHQKKEQFGWGRTGLLFLAFFGAMTSHYFAFLSIGLLGVCGLFYVEKGAKKYLLVAGGVAVAIFAIAHLGITQEQLSHGGLGWLAEPGVIWFVDFLKQIFQNSYWMLLLGIAFLVYAKKGKTRPNSPQGFSLIVMFVISVTAYLISIFYTPILRELVFQFILPFVFFGFIGPIESELNKKGINWVKRLLPFGVIFIFSLHSIFIYKIFEPVHYGVFKELAENQMDVNSHVKGHSISYAQNTNNVEYLNYYMPQKKLKEPITDWANKSAVYELADRARVSESEFFLYNWTNNFHVPMYLEVIKANFPKQIRVKKYFNSGSYLYSKTNSKSKSKDRLLKTLSGEEVFKGNEFFLDIRLSIKGLRSLIKEDEYFVLKANGKIYNKQKFFIVSEAHNSKDELIMRGEHALWYRAHDQYRLFPENRTTRMYSAFKLIDELKDDDYIKIYCWNPEKDTILFNNLKLYAVK